jgi:hypothetical protein
VVRKWHCGRQQGPARGGEQTVALHECPSWWHRSTTGSIGSVSLPLKIPREPMASWHIVTNSSNSSLSLSTFSACASVSKPRGLMHSARCNDGRDRARGGFIKRRGDLRHRNPDRRGEMRFPPAVQPPLQAGQATRVTERTDLPRATVFPSCGPRSNALPGSWQSHSVWSVSEPSWPAAALLPAASTCGPYANGSQLSERSRPSSYLQPAVL